MNADSRGWVFSLTGLTGLTLFPGYGLLAAGYFLYWVSEQSSQVRMHGPDMHILLEIGDEGRANYQLPLLPSIYDLRTTTYPLPKSRGWAFSLTGLTGLTGGFYSNQ